MFARLTMMWAAVRDSLWFVPALFTLLAAALAFLIVQVDRSFLASIGEFEHWFPTGGAEGARLVLSTIAGSLITVTGVVFSVTIVGLQLASTQFTPRILRNFLADRSNQIVLGVFISTFTYTLLVLRVVRTKLENDAAFVPHLSVALAIVLALVSVGFLIHFIHHAARSIQASVILSRVTTEALFLVDKLFPEETGEPEERPEGEAEVPSWPAEPIAAAEEGYLQAVNGDALFELGEKHQLLVRMAAPVGTFVVEGQALADVWAEETCDEEVRKKIQDAFLLGKERTPEQDVEFCIIEIADMAVKALSPGINDPTTAVHCIDRLTQILLALGKRRPPAPLRTKAGRVHFLTLSATFEGALGLAFDQILHFGRDNPAIVARLGESIKLLRSLLPGERQAVLRTYQDRLWCAVRKVS
jgi:uncharacterized membrane protein